jgi:hypothetical protein
LGSGTERSESGTAEASWTQTAWAEVDLTPVMARLVTAPAAGRSCPLGGWLAAWVPLTDGAGLTGEASNRCALARAWYLLRWGSWRAGAPCGPQEGWPPRPHPDRRLPVRVAAHSAGPRPASRPAGFVGLAHVPGRP